MVSTYINETPLFANLRLRDIERVEVLRGPQGTLYGSGSLGGSVRYIYNKPDLSAFYGEISGGVSQTKNGDGINYESDLMLNLPVTDTFGLRASVGYTEQAGFIDQVARYKRHPDGSPVLDNGATDPINDSANFYAGQPVFEHAEGVNDAETESYRLAAAWQPSDRVAANLSYHHQSDDVGGTQMNSYAMFGEDSLKNAALIAEPFEREVDVFALDVDIDMGFATFTASASRYQSEGEGSRDLTGFYELFSFWEAYYGNSPRPLIEDKSAFDDEGDVFEARLVSQGDGPFNWVLGAFYMKQDTAMSARQYYYGYDDYANACFIETGTFGGAPCGLGTLFGLQDANGPVPVVKDEAYLVDQNNTFEDRALFGELTWHITEQWQVTGGVRYYDQTFETTQVGGLEFVPGGIAARSLDTEDSDSLFKFNSSYYLNDDTNLYLVWSEGFRRGGANGLPNEAFGAAINNKAFLYEPDTTENIEVGVKGSLAGRYRYSVALYDIDWDNMQSNLSCTGLGLLCVVNVGEAQSRGVEAEFSWPPQRQPGDSHQLHLQRHRTEVPVPHPAGVHRRRYVLCRGGTRRRPARCQRAHPLPGRQLLPEPGQRLGAGLRRQRLLPQRCRVQPGNFEGHPGRLLAGQRRPQPERRPVEPARFRQQCRRRARSHRRRRPGPLGPPGQRHCEHAADLRPERPLPFLERGAHGTRAGLNFSPALFRCNV